MSKYVLEIEFEGKRDCYECPIWNTNWLECGAAQYENTQTCPLIKEDNDNE